MIPPPAILLSVGWWSNRKEPIAVAPRPSRTNSSENVPTKIRLRDMTRGSNLRPSASASTPETVAR